MLPLELLNQLGLGPDNVALVSRNMEMPSQLIDDLWKNGACQQDVGFAHG